MPSSWGDSWGSSWGDSWGTVSGGLAADNYFDKLGELGYYGAFSTRQMNYLYDEGLTAGSNVKRMNDRLVQLGYTGSTMDMMKQKADAEGYLSVTDMMKKTGMIPA
jgi:hypothetical protein